MDRLINVVAGDLYFTTLYKILRYSGRRIGEIYGVERDSKLSGGIKLKDIDFENNTIKTIILKTKKRKLQINCSKCKIQNTHKNKFCKECGFKLPEFDKSKLKYSIPEEITIPLLPQVKDILEVFIKNHKPKFKENNYIFRKWSLVFLKKQIKKHCEQASIKKNFSLHGFRHYFITQCKRKGMSNEKIALWTGHKNPSSLNTYNRMIPEDVIKDIENVDL
jgi:integrase